MLQLEQNWPRDTSAPLPPALVSLSKLHAAHQSFQSFAFGLHAIRPDHLAPDNTKRLKLHVGHHHIVSRQRCKTKSARDRALSPTSGVGSCQVGLHLAATRVALLVLGMLILKKEQAGTARTAHTNSEHNNHRREQLASGTCNHYHLNRY